ncbi:enoyl-CoA hydratase/isomerase family protein [Microbacterium sp. RD1]|uniref:enoyl-CoA hydratase/isomerase family protein n=1 Tax=Microbacterium sp. RD1 TaxID=3457313 RepID=UPI003FA5FA7D
MAQGTEATDSAVLVRREGSLGRLTLNRPRALNALSYDMIGDLAAPLSAWQTGGQVDVIVLDGAGERGLCAGGDIRQLAEQLRAGRTEDAARFFVDEYHLDAAIAESRVPVVAFADGITMGGGIGLAGHAAIRIVTERSRLAMPETRIGFTPDVGGSWLLSRAPGRLGEYLALTGESMDAADALHAGFADHLVPSDRLDALREALATRADPTLPELVLLFDETPGPSKLAAARPWIDDAFSAGSVAAIVDRLRARPEPAASVTADALAELSPTALAVTLEAVRRARALPDLRAALAQEYALVMWFAQTQPDLLEGIRAQVIDKDRSPRWRPADAADLPDDLLTSAFGYRPPLPLWEG